MRNFNWTPGQIEEISFSKVQMILDNLKEEHRKLERERRLAKMRSRRGRR